tara:strand:+ start:691 stop:2037 length:1347 start_codon:yes stop_codon:yes gene_type:complete
MISSGALKKRHTSWRLPVGLGISQKSLTDLIMVWAGTIIGAFVGMVAQMVTARTLGTEDYGTLSGALSIAALAAPLAVFGTTQYWLKAFGDEGWGAKRWIRPSLVFLTISTIFIIAAIALWAKFGPNDSRSQFVILALLITIVSVASIEIVSTKYQLEQKYGKFSILGLVTPLSRLIVAIIVVLTASLSDKLILTAIGYCLASIAILAGLTLPLKRLWNKRIDLKGHDVELLTFPQSDASIRHMLSQSWVFGIAGLLYLGWSQGHIVVATYAIGSHDAGIYSVALVILNAACLLPAVAFSKFLLPKIHRWASHDFKKLKLFNRWSSILMFGVGAVTAVLLYFGSDLAIRLAFGEEYGGAATVLKVLALTLPMRFLGYNAGAMLRTKRYMQIKIAILIVAVIFNLLLAFLFIPQWGVIGLAATVSITEFILVASYVYVVQFHYFKEERI